MLILLPATWKQVFLAFPESPERCRLFENLLAFRRDYEHLRLPVRRMVLYSISRIWPRSR